MKKRYLLAEDTIDAADLQDLIEWLKTNPWLTLGPLTSEFERGWTQWVGRDHALFVNSGSSANLLMYYAALLSGRLQNRKVVVPAVSWSKRSAGMPCARARWQMSSCGCRSRRGAWIA